jgi:leucyl aminopeptidase
MSARFAAPTDAAIPIEVVRKDGFDAWCETRPESERVWIAANGFSGSLGSVLILPDGAGGMARVLFGWGDAKARDLGRFHFAKAAETLPAGAYRIDAGLSGADLDEAAYAWLLSAYRFGRYKTAKPDGAALVAPDGIDAARIEAIADGEFLARDLINTPAADMGPDALEAAFLDLARTFDAKAQVIRGDDLLTRNFPMIHAVGRAADQAPRLLDLSWGDPAHTTVTLVGKGVCFDTGGLDIKPASSMALMKKDMGGAATVMGLAHILMALNLPVRLRVLVPAVENAISAGAFRPGDVLTSRKGLTVEVNNTDAEGRLVLADALALADEEAPDTLICMATLTGAARVAVGPDLAPFYTDDDGFSHALSRAGRRIKDPVWRMPFWTPYEGMIEPDIADLDNAPSGGFAGSITAALFLRRFVEKATTFAHFDIFGWTPAALPGRPKGAAFMGARALLDVLAREAEK